MFSTPCYGTIGIHALGLLVIVFGITEFPLPGCSISANETCMSVSGEINCYFKGSEKPVDWDKARQLCSSFNSTLPVIRNINHQDALAGYLKSHMKNSLAWTAGKSFTYRNWTWVNGAQLKESVQVKPQEIEEQHSDEVYAALNADSKFTALAASNELPYICQYEGTYCNSSSDIIVTDKCLRLFNDSRTWYDARNQCLMTNGDFAVIGGDARVFRRNLKLKQRYWIGLRKKFWRWSRSYKALSNDEIKYTNWDSNVYSRHGECISITASDGKWKAIACNELKTVVCQRGHRTTSTLTTETSVEDIPTKEKSFTSFAALGAGIIIIICIIVVIIFVLRSRKRPGSEIGHSKITSNSPHNHYEEVDSRITNLPVYTAANEPANDRVERSDDNRDDYAEIRLSTLDQSVDGATNQQPGIVYASLECKNEPTNLEPDNKPIHSPTKIGPLGDIYAMPDAKGHAVTFPGNTTGGTNSHPIIVTAKGDIYALPRKTSKSPTSIHPGEVVYANLQTET